MFGVYMCWEKKNYTVPNTFVVWMFNEKWNYSQGDYSFSGMGAKTHSTDLSCGKSDSKYMG